MITGIRVARDALSTGNTLSYTEDKTREGAVAYTKLIDDAGKTVFVGTHTKPDGTVDTVSYDRLIEVKMWWGEQLNDVFARIDPDVRFTVRDIATIADVGIDAVRKGMGRLGIVGERIMKTYAYTPAETSAFLSRDDGRQSAHEPRLSKHARTLLESHIEEKPDAWPERTKAWVIGYYGLCGTDKVSLGDLARGSGLTRQRVHHLIHEAVTPVISSRPTAYRKRKEKLKKDRRLRRKDVTLEELFELEPQ